MSNALVKGAKGIANENVKTQKNSKKSKRNSKKAKERVKESRKRSMKTDRDLRILLQNIDRKSYPAYKDTKGCYAFENFRLSIDHVQGDPFAAPSDISILVEGKKAAFPRDSYDRKDKRIALQDYLLRSFGRKLSDYNRVAKGSGKSGSLSVSRPGQEILERSACTIDAENGNILIRLTVGFPANGRTINSRELMKILFDFLPQCVEKTLYYESYDARSKKETAKVKALAEDQTEIRRQLKEQGLVAFVANDAVLPRESGASDRPMKDAVRFVSPASLEVTMQLPNQGRLKGMGIPKGITLIVGGGYHGKSTLLKALEMGVYNHIAGDGREFVITDATAVKSRAEDGRSIQNVDISMFIGELPNGKNTTSFQTEDASGSTSQAAGVVESIEAGAEVLLIDEDTSATNFMIRDELMQRVVLRNQEPIIPFIDRVEELYEKEQVSTILVAGSSGAYFYVADRVIQMECYQPIDITERARKEAMAYGSRTLAEEKKLGAMQFQTGRKPMPISTFRDSRLKIKTMGMDGIAINYDNIDLRLVEQLADAEQLSALGQLLKYAQVHFVDGKRTLREVVDLLEKTMDEQGLEAISTKAIARPRRQEIFACFNRYRAHPQSF